jgi:hypothetical protein
MYVSEKRGTSLDALGFMVITSTLRRGYKLTYT